MKRLTAVVLAGLFQALVASPSATAAVINGPISNPTNGRSYLLLSQNTWTASEAEAISLGGHLATVSDAAENSWLYNTFTRFGGINRTLWIGLNDAAQEGQFVWSSGEPVTYTNWWSAGGSPNNCCGGEDYVHIYDQSRGPSISTLWNDYGNGALEFGVALHGVVELSPVPEPAVYTLLIAGLCYLSRVKAGKRRLGA